MNIYVFLIAFPISLLGFVATMRAISRRYDLDYPSFWLVVYFALMLSIGISGVIG